ncbi:4011_t:CDS:2, partial [Racocetra fulgida]
DPNYVLDDKGKAHYLFSTTNKKTGVTEKVFRTHTKHGSNSGTKTQTSLSKSTTRSTPAKKKPQASSSKGPHVIDFEMDEIEDENPLPGFIDPITLEEVVKPAISPYGHVMGP